MLSLYSVKHKEAPPLAGRKREERDGSSIDMKLASIPYIFI
jgi:hypothetical protein